LDLSDMANCEKAVKGASLVYNLACNMGGMGFITTNRGLCMLSVLINTHLLMAGRKLGVQRHFFSSSACVYRSDKQLDSNAPPLVEADAYPASPEDGYGWEKLFSERLCRHFREDFGIETRVGRFHPIYGPQGTWEGGREKAPAAICRKVIDAVHRSTGEIEIWGDGEQSRTFLYVDDAVSGIQALMNSDLALPANIGSTELVTINQLADMAEGIAGVKLRRVYQPDAPRGVTGRNCDNTLITSRTGWTPSIALRDGLEQNYRWIYDQYMAKYGPGVRKRVSTSRPKPRRKKAARRRAAGSRR